MLCQAVIFKIFPLSLSVWSFQSYMTIYAVLRVCVCVTYDICDTEKEKVWVWD